MNRRCALLLLPAIAAASLLSYPPTSGADGPDPAAMWRKACAPCHAVPDPALRTDRAWIERVPVTWQVLAAEGTALAAGTAEYG